MTNSDRSTAGRDMLEVEHLLTPDQRRPMGADRLAFETTREAEGGGRNP